MAPPVRRKPSAPSQIKLPEPDYKKWGAMNLWTLHETALLLLGLDPGCTAESFPESLTEEIAELKRLLHRHVGQDLKHDFYDPSAEPDCMHKLNPALVIGWAESKNVVNLPSKLRDAVMETYPTNFRAGRLVERIQTLESENERLKRQGDQLAMELRKLEPLASTITHRTDELTILNAAIQKFWSVAPAIPPKKPTVTDWLKEQGIKSNRLAEAIDTIIRPPEHRKGGNKKIL